MSSNSSYEKQGDYHTEKDRTISWQEVEQAQGRMNNLSRGLANVFELGKNWGDNNVGITTDACVVPQLYPSPKTHKPLDPAEDPKTRPVVQASSCITSRPGELVADILEAALLAYPQNRLNVRVERTCT